MLQFQYTIMFIIFIFPFLSCKKLCFNVMFQKIFFKENNIKNYIISNIRERYLFISIEFVSKN